MWRPSTDRSGRDATSIGVVQTVAGWHVALWVDGKLIRQSKAMSEEAARSGANRMTSEFEKKYRRHA